MQDFVLYFPMGLCLLLLTGGYVSAAADLVCAG